MILAKANTAGECRACCEPESPPYLLEPMRNGWQFLLPATSVFLRTLNEILHQLKLILCLSVVLDHGVDRKNYALRNILVVECPLHQDFGRLLGSIV